jgi:transcriptional regulator with PAS, ATPase and Fis domain
MEDIEPLTENILDYLIKEMAVGQKELSKEAMRILKSYSWPGNVRELRNILERAINLSTGRIILPEHLPERIINGESYLPRNIGDIPKLKDVVEEVEKETIKKAILLAKGNKTLAAEKLGIHRTALYKKIYKYKMEDME